MTKETAGKWIKENILLLVISVLLTAFYADFQAYKFRMTETYDKVEDHCNTIRQAVHENTTVIYGTRLELEITKKEVEKIKEEQKEMWKHLPRGATKSIIKNP